MKKTREKTNFLDDNKVIFKENFIDIHGFTDSINYLDFHDFSSFFNQQNKTNQKPPKNLNFPIAEPRTSQNSPKSPISLKLKLENKKINQQNTLNPEFDQQNQEKEEEKNQDDTEISIETHKSYRRKHRQQPNTNKDLTNQQQNNETKISSQQNQEIDNENTKVQEEKTDNNDNIEDNEMKLSTTKRKKIKKVKKIIKIIEEQQNAEDNGDIPKPVFDDNEEVNDSINITQNQINNDDHDQKDQQITIKSKRRRRRINQNENENHENETKDTNLINENGALPKQDEHKEEESEPSFSITYKQMQENEQKNENTFSSSITPTNSPLRTSTVIEHKPWSPERKSMSPSVFIAPKNGSPVKEVLIHDIGEEISPPEQPAEPEIISITEDNFADSMPDGFSALFSLVLYPNKKNVEKYQLIDDQTGKEVLFAVRFSSMGSAGYNIFLSSNPNQQIAYITSNFTRSTFYAISEYSNPKSEICDIEFKSGFMGKAPNRQFNVFIPREGKIIEAREGSNLMKRQNDVLTLVPKPPKMKGGVFVLRFGGRVKMQSIKNFILVPPEDHENHIFVFGKVKEELFAGDVFYPLSPLQAFCIALTHFK